MSSDFYKKLDRIDHTIALILCSAAGLSIVAMMLHIVAGIYSRHFLGQPLGGVTEIVSAYDMVAVSFLSLAYVTHQKAHISVELFTQKLSEQMKQVIELAAAIFVTALSIWISYETAVAAIHSYSINEVWESGDGFLTVWPSRFFLPFGIGAMAFSYALDTLKRADRLINPSNSVEDL
ncbi:MAG: TRAP transporter small permease [Kordiimonadaceae bacterium]|jgi:TRAP-type C4-dicarboxylate transport system permease small subunit|nr:TRAP transporter small permease [Kordiimonadaceae bacterium]MBT6033248.1 TRAP transporter small permease [Kordiimonadaceae bacterium]